MPSGTRSSTPPACSGVREHTGVCRPALARKATGSESGCQTQPSAGRGRSLLCGVVLASVSRSSSRAASLHLPGLVPPISAHRGPGRRTRGAFRRAPSSNVGPGSVVRKTRGTKALDSPPNGTRRNADGGQAPWRIAVRRAITGISTPNLRPLNVVEPIQFDPHAMIASAPGLRVSPSASRPSRPSGARMAR